MSKNRKSFFYVLQVPKGSGKKRRVSSRVYRIKRNHPEFLGVVEFKKRALLKHKTIVRTFLIQNGHINREHLPERDYLLSAA